MIFFDNASTTKTDLDCMDILKMYCIDKFYNPSSLYHESVEVKRDLKKAREDIITALRGDGSLLFTSGGTESANIAIQGVVKKRNSKIVISKSEHSAVKNTAKKLKDSGYDIVECDVDICGRVDKEKFKQHIDEDTSLVSIMHVNNETGGVNDIKDLVKIAKNINKDIVFHSDGVQAIGKIPVDLRDLGVDLYSMSSHKIAAPKGAGALYVKNGISVNPIMFGGGQEMGIRPSTENIPGIMSFSYMIKKSIENLQNNIEKVENIRKFIFERTDSDILKILSDKNCSPYIMALAIKDVKGEVMLHSLEKYGIMIGTGSSCSSSKNQNNHWQMPYLPDYYKKGKLRLSFCHDNTIEQAEYFINKLNLEYTTLKRYS
ncbi:MAG: cysteine desulfurase family protein [Bacillota bacterium]